MQEGPKALIIGSGIGGIATAIILAGRGFSVSVYEKNSSPGGSPSVSVPDKPVPSQLSLKEGGV